MHCKGGCGKLRGEDGAFDPPDDAFGTQAWPNDDLFCYRCGRAEKLQQEAVEKADAEGKCRGGCGKVRSHEGADARYEPADEVHGTAAWRDDAMLCWRCGNAARWAKVAVADRPYEEQKRLNDFLLSDESIDQADYDRRMKLLDERLAAGSVKKEARWGGVSGDAEVTTRAGANSNPKTVAKCCLVS